jgi:valyl-tRNA synthetase
MLNNQGFITKAPEAKVKEIKDRVEELTGMLKNLEELQKKYQ